jgi:hypothetical protein
MTFSSLINFKLTLAADGALQAPFIMQETRL